eukprot:Gb_13912 [translate_table: standard]
MGIAKFWLVFASSSTRNSRPQLLTSLQSRGPYGRSQSHIVTPLFYRTLTNALPEEDSTTNAPIPQEGLGARMSFVVQELENIQRQNTEKGAALEKLRTWKDRNNNIKTDIEAPVTDSVDSEDQNKGEKEEAGQGFETDRTHFSSSPSHVEIAHPWPEWIELMERLIEQNYFDTRRSNEDEVIDKMSGGQAAYADERVDIFKDMSSVRNACLNFGRDRFDILRSLSRKDIQVLVGYGCPSLDRKVVCSGKRLRAYVHLDEGDVCSTCKLRASCEKAYIIPRQDDGARTIDVMRILLTYGLDPLIGSAENKLHARKTVKTSVCKLLKEVVKISATPIDPDLPKPVFTRPPPKVKQPPPPPRKRVGRDDIEMKKGDWLCPKCDFMNFAKNHNCLQCESKRPKRQLNPGEWECPECNYLNYRRNMTCYNCDHKRPEDDYTNSLGHGRDGNWVDNSSENQRSECPERRWERPLHTTSTSKSWNDDFDDDESDGAEVAAFEYADNSNINEGSLSNGDKESRKGGRIDDDIFDFEDLPVRGKGKVKEQNEIGGRKRGHGGKDLEWDRKPFAFNGKVKAFGDFDDFDDSDDEDENAGDSSLNGARNGTLYGRSNTPTSSRRNERAYDSDDTDDNSHLVGTRQTKTFERSVLSSSRGRVNKTYDSFDDLDEDDDGDSSESDDYGTKWKKSSKDRSIGSGARGTWNDRGRSDPFRTTPFASEDDTSLLSGRNWNRGNDPRSSGKGRAGNRNSRGHGGSFGGSPYRLDRSPSFNSRDKGRDKNNYGFKDELGEKGKYGRTNRYRGSGRTRDSRGRDDSFRGRPLKSDWGASFSSRDGRWGKNDFDSDPGKYGRINRHRGSGRTRDSRGRHDSFRGRPLKSDWGASFSSRDGRWGKNDFNFDDEPNEKRHNGRTSGLRGKERRGRRAQRL